MPVNTPRHSRFFWRSSAMFCILDANYQFQEVNAAWEANLGLSTGQLLAQNFLDFVHTEDYSATEYYFKQLVSGITAVSFSTLFRDHDNNYRNILWSVNNAATGQDDCAYYLVGMDITEREQPMVADEMISVLQEGVVLQYANGTIGACNPSAERILGLSAEQMMGWTLIDPDWRAIHEDGSPFPTETHPAICTLRTGQSYADVVMGVVKSDDSVIWIRIHSYPLWRDDVTTPYAVVISFSDITHYKENEQSLRLSDVNKPGLTSVSESNYDLWDWDLSSNEVHFSSRWRAMMGFSETAEITHIDMWHQRIHPADYKRVMADIQNHLDGLTQFCENTHRVQHQDGSYRWILNRSVMVKDANGKPHRMVGTHIDVTEPRRIEEELQEAEKKYRQIMEVEKDALFLIDAEDTQILDLNRTSTQLYGYSRNQLLEKALVDFSAQPEKLQNALKKGIKHNFQQYQRRDDGSVFPAEIMVSPFLYKGKQSFMVAITDLTEQQRIETALWESESKYRQLFEAASNPIVVFDANTQQIFDVNRAAVDLYGYSKEEWLHMTTEDVSAEPVKKRAAFNSGNKKVQLIPLRWHKKKDATVFPVEISTGSTYLFQGRSLICATLRDITERKAAEEAIRKERDFINTLVHASPAFFFAINPDGKTRMVNKAMLHALGFSLEEVIEYDYLKTFVPENERPLVATEFENLTKSMQPSLMESHVVSKAGKLLLVEWHSRAIVKANGALDYFFGVGIDVTERKKAQGHLRLFKSIIESSTEAITISNPDGQLVYVNPAYDQLFGGHNKEKESDVPTLSEHYPNDSLSVLNDEILPELQGGGSWEGELYMEDVDKERFPVWQRFDAVRDSKGQLLFSFVLMHDVSERQRMWDTLNKQWEEHQMIFNTIPAMIWYRNEENKLIRQNKRTRANFKHDPTTMEEITDCAEVIEAGKPQHNIMYAYRNEHNDKRWLQIDKIPYHDTQGTLIGVIVFATDVTDYKQTQATLQTSEERMYLVVENMPMMLGAFDSEGNIVAWNRTSETITGYSAAEIIGNPRSVETLFPDEADRRRMTTRWYSLDEEENYWETRVMCKDGQLRTLAWSSVSKQFPVPGWHTWHLGQDITQRKQSDQLFRENEALLASVFSVAQLGVCLTDDRGRFVQVNNAFAEMYGYKVEELIGEAFTLILPTETQGESVREYYSLLMSENKGLFFKEGEGIHAQGHSLKTQMLTSRVLLEDKRRLLVSIMIKKEDIAH